MCLPTCIVKFKRFHNIYMASVQDKIVILY